MSKTLSLICVAFLGLALSVAGCDCEGGLGGRPDAALDGRGSDGGGASIVGLRSLRIEPASATVVRRGSPQPLPSLRSSPPRPPSAPSSAPSPWIIVPLRSRISPIERFHISTMRLPPRRTSAGVVPSAASIPDGPSMHLSRISAKVGATTP